MGQGMDALTQLGLLASIAATYSGFIAVFIAFIGKDGRFAVSDGHFVQAMVLSTIGVVVLALSPPALSLILPVDQMWLDVTLFAIIAGLPSTLFQAWQQVKEARDPTQKIAAFWHVPGWVLGLGSFACFVAGLMQPELRAGFYVAGVTLVLGIAIWCFIAIVFRKFF
jgi:hypothetical protein